jgi:hypothetical protein
MKTFLLTTMTIALLGTNVAFAGSNTSNNNQAALNQLQQQIQTVQNNTNKQLVIAEKRLNTHINKQVSVLQKQLEAAQTANHKDLLTMQAALQASYNNLEQQIKAVAKQLLIVNKHLQSELQQINNNQK